jgi:hypothetical protein
MNLDFPPMQPQPEGVADQGPYAKTLALKPQRREERSPAEPETRNPQLEIRNKSKLMGMGQWANGKAHCFFANCEQSRLLQCRGRQGKTHLPTITPVQLVRGWRSTCGEHRSADILVRSSARTFFISKDRYSSRSSPACRGQECPRRAASAAFSLCALRVSAVKSPLGKFPQVVMISREKDRLEGCATCSPRL